MKFEWDKQKNETNIEKHEVSFDLAVQAFLDPNRVIHFDELHSTDREKRYFCFGKVKEGILTVRFTMRTPNIRIIGAGFWRSGKKVYDEKNGL